jgi:cytidyltransferase-like protein
MKRSRLDKFFYHREVNPDEVQWWRLEELPEKLPRPIVLVNGCFDLFHYAHARLLWAARQQAGDKGTVLVAIDSDERVRELKGLGHPILNWVERAAMFNYMPVNGLVEFGSEEDLEKIIVRLGPDLRVQGGDREAMTSRFPEVPKMFITDTGLHTGMIIARVLDRMAK